MAEAAHEVVGTRMIDDGCAYSDGSENVAAPGPARTIGGTPMCDLSSPIFADENEARRHLEKVRWPDGPICPHCGTVDAATKLNGKSARPGVYKCRACRAPFSVTVRTVYERSHVPLHKWLLATHLLSSSEKSVSAQQLHRTLGVSYKSAWLMIRRIRGGGPNAAGTGGQNELPKSMTSVWIGECVIPKVTQSELKAFSQRGRSRKG